MLDHLLHQNEHQSRKIEINVNFEIRNSKHKNINQCQLKVPPNVAARHRRQDKNRVVQCAWNMQLLCNINQFSSHNVRVCINVKDHMYRHLHMKIQFMLMKHQSKLKANYQIKNHQDSK